MINKARVKELLLSGKTQREVAIELESTTQNISLIAKKLKLSRGEYGLGLRLAKRRNAVLAKREKEWGRTEWVLDNLSRAQSFRFQRKRQNNRHLKKWEWDLEMRDIVWPTLCPILGIPLDYFAPVRAENSPSFDRIDCSKGYIKGNVEIVSWRANRIKNDGTKEEHQKIVEWMTKRGVELPPSAK